MRKSHKIIYVAIIFLFIACNKESSLIWVPGWKETSSLGTPRSGAAVVEANGFIYIIGGTNNYGFLKTTEYAKIQQDGSLGPWRRGPFLYEARGFTDAAVYNNYIYVVGGSSGPTDKHLIRSVVRAHIKPDGSLTPWIKEMSSMNMPRRCAKVEILNNHIYSFGGFGGDLLNTVEHAEIMDDGTLGDWYEEGEKLTLLRYINGVKKVKNDIYLIGGHHPFEGTGITGVEWSRVIDSAGFQRWKETNDLRIERYALSAATHGDEIYALGGLSGAKFLDSVEKTIVGSNGDLAPWQSTTPLSRPNALFNTVVYKDWIYVLGGANDERSFTEVEYATFNEFGDIGFWGTREEAATFKESVRKNDEKSNIPLPNEGIIKNLLQTDGYTYIMASRKGRDEWLAAPKAELDVGGRIRYDSGVQMLDFYSKKLKRKFPEIIFVGKVQKIEAESGKVQKLGGRYLHLQAGASASR